MILMNEKSYGVDSCGLYFQYGGGSTYGDGLEYGDGKGDGHFYECVYDRRKLSGRGDGCGQEDRMWTLSTD